ncbi:MULTISPECIES: sulfatase-like hydrolase/transferase [Halomonas]|uniref:sulfatase-like hydrolase/transferase n=1 Tax=Halomonas TaxID=2745 RepID=UPI001A8DE4A7|nr:MULTISPECIES: sulfatase-like hydrolase/transferase [Halomonas]MBN8412822.1 sulfatase-like hydrolase/transferase [Halomonas litopenaei]MBY5925117.1 sulfatase-like hydrolase/transferase [Halomonas sp. DP4Y7-2]MBY5928949.1 sulfatase-like hydrolase/transferase [Halomonas sp. DP8Y7-3]MBY5983536.1 sulfatase-like hydrolase/transferase [Halomonas sp. DP5Y7-2]MBY6232158.1 sulfatase-like hydrolase/transferase [Halomonas sp. DP4Y7-1]
MPVPFPITSPWLRWAVHLLLGLAIGHAVVMVTRLPGWCLPIPAIIWCLVAGWKRWGDPPPPRLRIRVIPWALVPLAFWGIYVYLASSFGQVDMGAVYFHLQAGISQHGGSERTIAAIIYTLAMVLILAGYTWLVRADYRWQRWDHWLAFVLLLGNPMFYSMGQRGAAVVTDPGTWLDRRYVDPVILKAPQRPPNLLLIYLESLERTYSDTARFGDAYADLAALEPQAVVFDNVRQIDNTGWTMAGMIASQCGTPLMPAGLLHDSQFDPLHHVVPGVDCLGDLLARLGYRQTFMGGASTEFAGKGLFYTDHAYQRVLGREQLVERLDDSQYLNSWGLYDDSLYEMAVDEIRRLDRQQGPWNMTLLNLSAHAPAGYPSQACEAEQGVHDGVDILYAVKCSGWLTRRLLEQLEDEQLLDNTLVVIASDHLTMRVSAWDQLIQTPRTNTLMMMGNALTPARISTQATTMDTLPTLLEAMGFTIDWHRAGLGVSLFSGEPTLAEQVGLEALNGYMREETALQERLWEGLAPAYRTSGQPDAPPEAPHQP